MPEDKQVTNLKKANAHYLWLFIGVNLAAFLGVYISAELSGSAIEHFWQKVSAKDGLIALCVPLATIVLNGLLGDTAKARLVFWRWRCPLPGCRAFSRHMHNDPRIDCDALTAKHGKLPRAAKEQNALWYQMYRAHADKLTVLHAHRMYLLTRDMAGLSAIFAVAFLAGALFSPASWKTVAGYGGFLVLQYVALAMAARNYGVRFVTNVLTEESQPSQQGRVGVNADIETQAK